MNVHKKNRTKVALALKFEAVVMAVLSLDLLVQVTFCIISLLRCSDSSNHPIPILPSSVGGNLEYMKSRTVSLTTLMCL